MTIGKDLIEKIRGAPAEGVEARPVEVERDGVRVRATVRGADRYGCAIDHVRVTAPGRPVPPEERGGVLRRQAERLAERSPGLPERLKVHEVDPGVGVGILRSRPEEVRGRRYTEVRLRGGREAEVERYEYRPEAGRRERIPQGFTHESLERLADDLAEVVGGGG